MGDQNCNTEHNDVFTFSSCHSLLHAYLNLEIFITINKSQRSYSDNKFSDIFLTLVSLNYAYCYNFISNDSSEDFNRSIFCNLQIHRETHWLVFLMKIWSQWVRMNHLNWSQFICHKSESQRVESWLMTLILGWLLWAPLCCLWTWQLLSFYGTYIAYIKIWRFFLYIWRLWQAF